MNMDLLGKILGILSAFATAGLSVQDTMGVSHSTIFGTVCRAILGLSLAKLVHAVHGGAAGYGQSGATTDAGGA